MYVRFRSARPSNDLKALRRFYVDGLSCTVVAEWLDHDGFDGLVVGAPGGGDWQAEFVRQHGHAAPTAPSAEHLLVFYVADRATLEQRAARLRAVGFDAVVPNNPYWQRHGATFADPDGYHVVVATLPASSTPAG